MGASKKVTADCVALG